MKKDKNKAALLAIFFGIIGAQKWYLGNEIEFGFCLIVGIMTGGIATLLFGIYDGYQLFKQSYYTFNQRYNRPPEKGYTLN